MTSVRPVLRRRCCAGFFLAEVAVAAFMFAICFAAAVSLIHSARSQLEATREALVAQELAQTELNRVRSWAPYVPPECKDMPVAQTGPAATALPGLSCTMSVSNHDVDEPRLKRVTIDVAWRGKREQRMHVRLQTLVFGRPLAIGEETQ